MPVTLNSPSDVAGDHAYLTGVGNNVPVTNSMRFDIGLAPGGPFTAHSSPEYVGTNIANQNIAYQVPAGTLDAETAYYVRLVELNASDAIVNTSSVAAFNTTSAGFVATSCLPPCVVMEAIPLPEVGWPPPYVAPTP